VRDVELDDDLFVEFFLGRLLVKRLTVTQDVNRRHVVQRVDAEGGKESLQ